MPNTPQRSTPFSPSGPAPPFTAAAVSPPWQQPASPAETAEFAPNAFSGSSQYAPVEGGPKWYDRFLDVLLGEDESNPKNRLALICMKCRLVNGLAPPGAKSSEDVGRWRCSNCGTMNGEESEARRIVAEIKDATASSASIRPADDPKEMIHSHNGLDDEAVLVGHEEDGESDVTQYSDDGKQGLREGSTTIEATSEALPEVSSGKGKKGRPKGSKK